MCSPPHHQECPGALREQLARVLATRVPRPTHSERLDVYQAMVPGGDDEVLETPAVAGVRLQRRDLRTLHATSWLNDKVIDYYGGAIEARADRCATGRRRFNVLSTHLFTKLMGSGRYEYDEVRNWTQSNPQDAFHLATVDADTVFAPINISGVHWALVEIDMRRQRVILHDPLYNDDCARATRAFARWACDEARQSVDVHDDPNRWEPDCWECVVNPPWACAPRQKNGYDCGVFALALLEHRARGAVPGYTQDDMGDLRVRIAADLLRGQVD